MSISQNPKTLFILGLLFALASVGVAQDGDSTAGLARTRYLGSLGILPSSREVVVEDFVNYHRHEIGRPKAGEAVGLDVRWGNEEVRTHGDAVLQVGLSTALTHDRDELRPLNLALVIDKSGSMADDNKLVRVKAALLKLVSQLRQTDVLSIVVFDSDAKVLLPASPMTDRESVESLIRDIEPGSATNLNGGLMLGYQEALRHFRKNATNRVILLTDGIANRGVTDPAKIAQGSLSYNDRGIDLCTIGVGLDLNKDLLRELAKSGRGLFHFVADSDDIDQVFVKELQSQLSPVAAEPNLTIDYGAGLSLKKVYGYGPVLGEKSVRVKLDNMNSGMTEAILVRFRPDAEAPNHRRLRVKVRLSYYDLVRKKSVELEQDTLITVSDGPQNETQEDMSVAKNYTIACMAQAIREMAAACENHQYRQAENLLDGAIQLTTRRYPNLEDEDIKRTLSIATKYCDVLRKQNQTDDREDRGDSVLTGQAQGPSIVPNGDFRLGNTQFMSGLDYIAPGNDSLWACNYTIAPAFNNPVLHHLVQLGDFAAPKKPNGNEQVFFANAGGNEPLNLWSTIVQCKPNTRYRISFSGISLSGSEWSQGHEIPTEDWVPSYQITVGTERSKPQTAGCGHYSEISMIWDSKTAITAVVSIARVSTGRGGLIGIANIEMVPVVRN